MKLTEIRIESSHQDKSFSDMQKFVLSPEYLNDGKPYPMDLTLDNLHLTSLKGFPRVVLGSIDLGHNSLEDWEGGPKEVHGNLYLHNNDFLTFEGIFDHLKLVNGLMYLWSSSQHPLSNPLKRNVLGLLRIEKLKGLTTSKYPFPKWAQIVNKHLQSTMNTRERMYACQDELETEGLSEYAQL